MSLRVGVQKSVLKDRHHRMGLLKRANQILSRHMTVKIIRNIGMMFNFHKKRLVRVLLVEDSKSVDRYKVKYDANNQGVKVHHGNFANFRG